MAPEQASGKEALSAPADIFSLGCVLFECLTGEPLFTGAHVMAVLAKILMAEPPRLDEKLPFAPAGLDALLARMLAKSPDERPADGHAAAAALRGLGEMPAQREERTPSSGRAERALTGSEKRAVAVILVGAPGDAAGGATLEAAAEIELRAEAERHGGHFERLMGGAAIVMLTGAALATDLAAEASRCALSLQRHAPGRPIALSMGRAEITGPLPMGPAIDRAARLASEASADGVRLDDVVAGLLDARFDVREAESSYWLLGERELGEGTRTLLGKATPCVGRELELRMLEGMFAQCVEEATAQAVLVVAPAGAGKSRLAQEFLRLVRARGEGAAIWIGRGDSLRAGSAFGLLGQALRGASGVRDGEAIEVRREKVRARVAEVVAEGERQRVTEFLGEILGTPFPDEDSLPLAAARRDAQLMNEQMRQAFVDFLAGECKKRPVLLLLEDLHWGDRPTVQFLDRALRDLAEAPLFVLAMARPEVHRLFPKLWAGRGAHEVRLRELNRKAIERLTRHVMGDKAGPETVEKLLRLSEGNAFYLEELLRWAAEGRGGELPETVVAMVQSRLGALDADARRILRAASVFGEVCWSGGVVSLLGGAARPSSLRERLAELAEREVLVKRKDSRFPGEEEYAFRHALLREGAYAMLTEEDRALGHRLAGEWLERHGEGDALLLAEHFEKGGDGPRAGSHYLRAAETASRGGDSEAAIARARRGLSCDVPEEARISLLHLICESRVWRVDLIRDALPEAEELLALARPGSKSWSLGAFAKFLSSLASGQIDAAFAMGRAISETEPSPDDLGTLLQVQSGVMTSVLLIMGRLDEAERTQRRIRALTASSGERDTLALYWSSLAFLVGALLAQDRELYRGLCAADTALANAGAVHDRRLVQGTRMLRAMVLWQLGAVAEAERELSAMELPDSEYSMSSSFRPFSLAWMLVERGAFREAHAQAFALVESGRARGLTQDEQLGHWALAEVRRREGDLEGAERDIQQALALLGAASPLNDPPTRATLAALRLAQGRPDEALAAAEEGMARLEELGACLFNRGRSLRLVHVECLRACGKDEAARAALEKARACILAIADEIDDPTYRKTFLEDVPENRQTLALAREWLGP
jgi:hypothetical protein